MGSTKLDFCTLDVFTSDRFAGNPLAVVKVPSGSALSQDQRQLIAREFNFSETVFVIDSPNDSLERTIYIHTTTSELPFAGHPTIGTIVSICAESPSSRDSQKFAIVTKAGRIDAEYAPQTKLAVASIPHNIHTHKWRLGRNLVEGIQEDVRKLRAAPQPADTGNDLLKTYPVVSIVEGMTFALVDLPDLEQLGRLKVGSGSLPQAREVLDKDWVPSLLAPYYYVILADEGDGITRIRTRMIEHTGEDPATGSAACTLGAYLSLKAGTAAKSYIYNIVQGMEMRRRSTIGVEVKLDVSGQGVEKVMLSGNAIPVTQGILFSP